ncbi:MAG: hypothetical protein D6781_00775 [Verrucomicrobia bacterium]|nr:MAG: hypothetical protein D6781_00775 [Verrucomicrobiota bacterium]
MKYSEQAWDRLLRLARSAPQPAPESTRAPLGFSARVVAQWHAEMGAAVREAVWERLALRGLGVACVLALIAAAVALPLSDGPFADELANLADPLVDVASLAE